MGYMKQMAIELDELLMSVAQAPDTEALAAELYAAGWRTPTEVQVAVGALREGDTKRAEFILAGADTNPVSTAEACS